MREGVEGRIFELSKPPINEHAKYPMPNGCAYTIRSIRGDKVKITVKPPLFYMAGDRVIHKLLGMSAYLVDVLEDKEATSENRRAFIRTREGNLEAKLTYPIKFRTQSVKTA